VRYLNIRLFTAFIICLSSWSNCLADNTIIIKKYKKPSKALLNRKIIYMNMGNAPAASSTQSKGLSNLASPVQNSKPIAKSIPQKTYKVKSLDKKGFAINKLTQKPQLDSIANGLDRQNTNGSNIDNSGEYIDDDWGEYTEYKDVVMEESLGVSARIRQH
jgi:hypothetical protein